MTHSERVLHDNMYECEHCSDPGFYSFKVNGFMFNYCHNHLKECNISFDEVDSDYSPVEDRLERFMEAFLKRNDGEQIP